jgi:putative transposase
MSGRRRRRRVEPTDDWEQLELLCKWPEQVRYEEIRPLVLFGSPVGERAERTGASERTLYRRVDRFEVEGMESLFGADAGRRRRLPPAMRRLVVDLKAEYPRFSLNEIAKICYVRFGRTPSRHTVKKVLAEEPMPLRMVRRYPPYHEIPEPRERRLVVVALHAEGWTVKAIAGYLRVDRDTVYRALRRWIEEGEAGLEDRPAGRPKGVRKVTLAAMDAARRLQRNPGLGEVRVHAALKQIGIHLSPRTVGRILALNHELYGLEKPKGSPRQPKAMPFASNRRHRYWTADVRYLDVVDEHLLGGRAYAITVLENHSRAVLASAVSPTQDLPAFLAVLYVAVQRYGSPEVLVTDGGSIFRANQARAIYEALGIGKQEIERGRPWQSYVETTFNIQRRMADWHFARRRAGRSSSRRTTPGPGTTTPRPTGPTGSGRTAGAPRRRCSAGSPACGTAPRTSSAPSSRPASRGYWTPWATRVFGTGGSTARKGWRGGRPPSGCSRAASPSSSPARPFPVTTWNWRQGPESCGR